MGFCLTLCLVVEKIKGKKIKHVKRMELEKKWLSVGGGYNQILPHVNRHFAKPPPIGGQLWGGVGLKSTLGGGVMPNSNFN